MGDHSLVNVNISIMNTKFNTTLCQAMTALFYLRYGFYGLPTTQNRSFQFKCSLLSLWLLKVRTREGDSTRGPSHPATGLPGTLHVALHERRRRGASDGPAAHDLLPHLHLRPRVLQADAERPDGHGAQPHLLLVLCPQRQFQVGMQSCGARRISVVSFRKSVIALFKALRTKMPNSKPTGIEMRNLQAADKFENAAASAPLLPRPPPTELTGNKRVKISASTNFSVLRCTDDGAIGHSVKSLSRSLSMWYRSLIYGTYSRAQNILFTLVSNFKVVLDDLVFGFVIILTELTRYIKSDN